MRIWTRSYQESGVGPLRLMQFVEEVDLEGLKVTNLLAH